MPWEPFADRYTNLLLVGSGGFGEVYQAYDPRARRQVAIKILKEELAKDADWRRRFDHEAYAVTTLDIHPNITAVFDLGEFAGRPYIVMEFVKGETLAKLIDERIPLQTLNASS